MTSPRISADVSVRYFSMNPFFSERLELIITNIVKEAPNDINQITLIHKILSAGVGAILTSIMVTPFDVVKTRMQSVDTLKDNEIISRPSLLNNPHAQIRIHNTEVSTNVNNPSTIKLRINGTWQGIHSIGTTEGMRALWRGLTPTL